MKSFYSLLLTILCVNLFPPFSYTQGTEVRLRLSPSVSFGSDFQSYFHIGENAFIDDFVSLDNFLDHSSGTGPSRSIPQIGFIFSGDVIYASKGNWHLASSISLNFFRTRYKTQLIYNGTLVQMQDLSDEYGRSSISYIDLAPLSARYIHPDKHFELGITPIFMRPFRFPQFMRSWLGPSYLRLFNVPTEDITVEIDGETRDILHIAYFEGGKTIRAWTPSLEVYAQYTFSSKLFLFSTARYIPGSVFRYDPELTTQETSQFHFLINAGLGIKL